MNWLKKKRKYILIFSLLILLELVVLYYPLDYMIYYGGKASDLSQYVEVENGDLDDEGAFYMLSIYSSKATGAPWLRAKFDSDMDIKPIENVVPTGMNMEEYHEIMIQDMANSQKKATLLALQSAGLTVEVQGGGLELTKFAETTLVKDVLQIGDILKTCENRRLLLNEDLQRLLLNYSPGDSVELEILRADQMLLVSAILSQDETGKAKLGIYVSSTPWELVHDQKITFKEEGIGGGSAGMMMTLEIMNQLLEIDLSKGYKVAGTGTVRLDGTIGPIEGVKQKMRGAEAEGAEYFLVAEANAETAFSLTKSIQVISVTTLQDALDFLADLPPR